MPETRRSAEVSTPVLDDWFRPHDSPPGATTRLFLFHHAGGTAAAYAGWPSLLPPDVGVQAIQFPGRHDGPGQRPYTRIEPLVTVLREALLAELDDRPYALFGHSMGALVAY